MRIAVGDIGGTHARFALAELTTGAPPRLGEMHKYRTAEHAGLESAWARFRADIGGEMPDAAAFAVAAPIEGGELRFANSHWVIETATLQADLGLSRLLLLNDFAAVAHAVPALPLQLLLGPDCYLPDVVTVVGLGTGLGVSILVEQRHVIATEGAHIAFAPQTPAQARLEAALRARYERCSVERIVSGPGLLNIYRHLGGDTQAIPDSAALWTAAIDGSDPLAGEALDLLLACFGAAAGDLCLAHGSLALVVTGGLANRLSIRMLSEPFVNGFQSKGRFTARMTFLPVFLATEPEPGLLGAAIAFQQTL